MTNTVYNTTQLNKNKKSGNMIITGFQLNTMKKTACTVWRPKQSFGKDSSMCPFMSIVPNNIHWCKKFVPHNTQFHSDSSGFHFARVSPQAGLSAAGIQPINPSGCSSYPSLFFVLSFLTARRKALASLDRRANLFGLEVRG